MPYARGSDMLDQDGSVDVGECITAMFFLSAGSDIGIVWNSWRK